MPFLPCLDFDAMEVLYSNPDLVPSFIFSPICSFVMCFAVCSHFLVCLNGSHSPCRRCTTYICKVLFCAAALFSRNSDEAVEACLKNGGPLIWRVQTWENFLTPSERQIVSMYLPEGVDPESAVKALLSGGNFHFGNPLQMWSVANP